MAKCFFEVKQAKNCPASAFTYKDRLPKNALIVIGALRI